MSGEMVVRGRRSNRLGCGGDFRFIVQRNVTTPAQVIVGPELD
jgi:hypothetical protein